LKLSLCAYEFCRGLPIFEKIGRKADGV
jgi:hypothetical protein